jgi:hypothetical protein
MLQDQLIAVLVATFLEPAVRFIKNKFQLSGSAMLLVTAAVAGVGAVAVVGIQVAREGGTFDLDRIVSLIPTVFAVGQVIYALL